MFDQSWQRGQKGEGLRRFLKRDLLVRSRGISELLARGMTKLNERASFLKHSKARTPEQRCIDAVFIDLAVVLDLLRSSLIEILGLRELRNIYSLCSLWFDNNVYAGTTYYLNHREHRERCSQSKKHK